VIQGDATLSGNQVRLGNTPGLVVIEAFQVGNSEFISVSREISFCINPPTPSLTQIGDNLQASGFSGYQWFINGNAIGGFTANGILRPDRNGVYSVKSATSDGCFSGFSNQLAIQRVLALNPAEDGIFVFPNPGQEYLRIRIPDQQKLLEVSVSDMNGRHLLTQNDSSIDIRNFPAGTYILKVKTSGSEAVTRFIKN
jgi:hypothetical protein